MPELPPVITATLVIVMLSLPLEAVRVPPLSTQYLDAIAPFFGLPAIAS
jgi:hypothetical protein